MKISRNILIFLLVIGLASSCKLFEKKGEKKEEKKEEEVDVDLGLENIPLTEKERVQFDYMYMNASKEKILGNYEKAARLYAQCVKLDDSKSGPYYELANIYDLMQEDIYALDFIEKAVELEGDNFWYNLLYAQSLQKNGKYKESSAIFEKMVKANPDKPDLYFDWAKVLLYDEQFEKALEVYSMLEERIGLNEEVILKKHRLYKEMGNVEKAAGEMKKLIELHPDESRYYGILADLYLENGMEEKALEMYNEILERDPKDPYIHLSLADYYRTVGEHKKSFGALKEAFKNENLDIDTKIQILLSFYSLTQNNDELKEDAMDLNEILVKVHPKEAKSHAMYADFLYREGSLEEARDQYRAAIELDKSKFLIWRQLLLIEAELQDYQSMLKESKEAMELFPSQPLVYYFRGLGNIQKKDYQAALEYLNLGKDYVINNKSLLVQFYSNLGDVYHRLEKHESSDNAYQQALELDSMNQYVLNNYSYYLSLRGEDLDRAEEMAKKANAITPGESTYLDTYGWVMYKKGDYEKAKELLEEAVNKGGGKSTEILEHLGDTYYQLGKKEKALEYWNKAAEYGKGSEYLEKKIEEGKLYE